MISPKLVAIFGFSSATNLPIPIAADAAGILQVGPPVSAGQTVSIENTSQLSFSQGAPVQGLVTAAYLYATDEISPNAYQLISGSTGSDGDTPNLNGVLFDVAHLRGWNGTGWDRIRVANVFKSVLATAAGNTVVWTPTVGKKFRLMGYTLSVAGTLAATGVELMKLTDGVAGTTIAQHQAAMIQTTTVSISGGDTQIGAALGNGYLSGAINTALQVNLSTAITGGGGCVVNAWGTEE